MKFVYYGETMNPYFASLSTLISAWRRDNRRKTDNERYYLDRLAGFKRGWSVRTLATQIANEDNQ